MVLRPRPYDSCNIFLFRRNDEPLSSAARSDQPDSGSLRHGSLRLLAHSGGSETRTSRSRCRSDGARAPGPKPRATASCGGLGPALKHDMVVNLQAIAMMAEVLNAKLERGGTPSAAELQASIAKLNRLAREAVANCLKVSSWIEPGEDEGVRLADGVDECLALLASNFNFRGFVVTKELPDSAFQVSHVILRNLLDRLADHAHRRGRGALRGASQGRDRFAVSRRSRCASARARTSSRACLTSPVIANWSGRMCRRWRWPSRSSWFAATTRS